MFTGEALGVVGQTIAGIVSLTTVVMVWTGLALAYRRLISPLCTFRSGGTQNVKLALTPISRERTTIEKS